MIRKPHLRTPGYVYGAVGEVERVCGVFADPSRLAYRDSTPIPQPLYRVRFQAQALWPTPTTGGGSAAADTVDVEIYQSWLQAATGAELEQFNHTGDWGNTSTIDSSHASGADDAGGGKDVFLGCPIDPNDLPPHSYNSSTNEHAEHEHSHGGDGGHGHSHGEGEEAHVHLSRPEVEQVAVDREPAEEAPLQPLAEALARLLVAEGIVTAAELADGVAALETLGKQGEGVQMVAKAWCDPQFKALLLTDAAAAAAEMGFAASNYASEDDEGSNNGNDGGGGAAFIPSPQGHTVLTVVENTEDVHNMVVRMLFDFLLFFLYFLYGFWGAGI